MKKNSKNKEQLRSYEFKHNINKNKLAIIQDIIYPEYKRVAKILLNEHLNEYRKTCLLPNNLNNKLYKPIETILSERYKDVINRQVVGMLNSKLTNFKTKFVKLVMSCDSFDEDTKKKLCIINKYNLYYYKGEYSSNNISISEDIFKLAKWIFKNFIGYFPSCNHINMVMQKKVAKLEKSNKINSYKYPYIIRLSTHIKGKLIDLPLCKNSYFENKIGNLKNSTEFVFKDGKLKYIKLILDIDKEEISNNIKPIEGNELILDIGITNLFGTDKGELLGKRYLRQLKRMDKNLIKVQNKLKEKYGKRVKLSKFYEYTNLVHRIKQYTKNEIHRMINLLYKRHLPKVIKLEELDFKNSNLSKTLNRILNKFGLGVINNKLKSLEYLGVKIIYIDAAYSSKTCGNCHYVDSRNRKKQDTFECLCCGLKQHADINSTRTLDWFSERFGEKLFYGKKGREEKLKFIIEDFIDNKFWMNNESVIQAIQKNKYFISFQSKIKENTNLS